MTIWSRYSGKLIYLDSNVLIYAIEGGTRFDGILAELVAAIDSGDINVTTSELTLAEVLTKPLSIGATQLVATYEALLGATSPVDVIPVTRAILVSAAHKRFQHGLRLLDAIHAATADAVAADHLLPNDRRMATVASAGVFLADLLASR